MTEDFEPTNGEEMEEEVPISEEPMSSMEGITDDDKLWAFLAYLFPVLGPIIVFLMEEKKGRPFIRAHNMQALVWGAIVLVVGGFLTPFLIFCPGLPVLVLWLIGAYWGWQAYQGQEVTIPFITDFVKNQGWA